MRRPLKLDRALVESAIEDVESALHGMAATNAIEEVTGYIVVMDPSSPALESDFYEATLHEHRFIGPEVPPWEYDYRKIAKAKAKASWETGLSTRELRESWPLYETRGDSPWAGSIVVDYCGYKIVIAVSGYSQPVDEMICWWFFHRLVALTREDLPDDTLVGGESVEVE